MNSIRILGGITLRQSSLWKVVVQYRTVKTSPIWRQKVPKVPNSSKTAVPKISDVKRLIGLAKPERLKLAGALGLLVVSSGVTMAVPFCIGKVIDIIYTASQEGKMEEKLNSLCQILLVVFLLGGVANFGRVYLMTVAGQNIVKRLREKLFNSVMKQEIGFFDKTKTGELINRLSADASLVGQSVTNNISDGLRSIAQAVGGVGMMVYVSAKLTAISLGIVPPVALVSIIYGRYVRNITKQVQTSLADATQLAEEKVGNIRTVRAFAQEEKECAAYDQKISHVLKLSYKEALARGIFWGFTGMSGNVIVLSVFYYGGLMMTESQMTVGELSAFLLYAAYVGVSMGGLTTFYTELMRGLGASSRLWQLVDREPRIPVAAGLSPSMSPQGNINFNNINFHYPSRPETTIFSDLSLNVPSGSVTAVVGPSGSGKSTLGSLLLRMYDPTQGKYTPHLYDPTQGKYTPHLYDPTQGKYTPHLYDPTQSRYTPRMYDPTQSRYTPRMYDPTQSRYTPHLYDPTQGKYAPRLYDPTQGKYTPHLYDPTQGKYSPLLYDPTQGKYSPLLYDPTQGKYIPHLYDPTQGKYTSRMYDPTQGKYSPLLYDPTQGKYIPHLYDPTQGKYTSRMYDPTQGKYSPLLYDPTQGKYSPLLYDPTQGKYIPHLYDPTQGKYTACTILRKVGTLPACTIPHKVSTLPACTIPRKVSTLPDCMIQCKASTHIHM
ncbi:ATP-binding cassette sub-family B member 10, mitochondrial-like isoform X1 [Haliotis rufescens]|uniref:ATP-binding cassette sub-family B member 10, mitochondrial-like isoform X1 n=1 Tax=Haliotis rufescens TaxID=6454 RepID=UPI00201F43A5|nr:ATP-binding cassette sub-family B member 10, mitochondrial-like isoform X1 [Haliotis rufescens]